jgi:opacity protein-like surface antigen
MFNYPKLLSASAAFLLAACSSSAQASDSLAGTEWTGHYDLGPVTLRFQDDSKVSMIDSSGQVTGTYARKDDSVSIMAVQGDIRLVCQGKIQGQSMSGIAVTNRGARMKFQLTLSATPQRPKRHRLVRVPRM